MSLAAVVVVGSVTASAHARSASRAAARPSAVKGEIVYPCLANYSPSGWFPELCAAGLGGSYVITNEKQAKDDPAWSSDGTLLAYVVNGRIYVHNVWKYERQWAGDSLLLGPGQDPTWSPHARSLAFSEGGDVYVMSATGGNRQRLTRDPAVEDAPSWSPDGKMIAFDRAGEVWEIGADGKGPRSLGAGSDPAWAPDGRRLAFSYQGDIWTMKADGSSRQNITHTPDVGETKPVWAAGSRDLAFVGVPTGGGKADLYEMQLGHRIQDLAVAVDQPLAQLSLAWQPVRVLVETVSDHPPYVSVRDAQGHRLSKIRGGALELAYVDHSKHHGFAWSLGRQGYIGSWTIRFTGVRWPKLSANGIDHLDSTSGGWMPGRVTYWDPAHKHIRGSFRIVDAP